MSDGDRRISRFRWLNVIGLVMAAGGMLLQIAAGSELYPSLTGPIVLLATALLVAFSPFRWTPLVGIAVPLVLGIGAIVAAAMTGEFIDQLTSGNAGIVLGSLLHVIGLAAAVSAGIWMLLNRQGQAGVEH
jgi:hypothetical protein